MIIIIMMMMATIMGPTLLLIERVNVCVCRSDQTSSDGHGSEADETGCTSSLSIHSCLYLCIHVGFAPLYLDKSKREKVAGKSVYGRVGTEQMPCHTK